jgi:hypothetical protein
VAVLRTSVKKKTNEEFGDVAFAMNTTSSGAPFRKQQPKASTMSGVG